MKKVLLTIGLISFLGVTSCKKDIYGCTDSASLNYSTEANKDDGSCMKAPQTLFEEQFTMSFGPTTAYGTYYPSFNYESGDVIIIEHLTDVANNYWSAMPIVTSGAVVWGEYGYDDGDIWIYTDEVNSGNGYPWPANVTFAFRALLIKKGALKLNKDLKNMSIEEIKSIMN